MIVYVVYTIEDAYTAAGFDQHTYIDSVWGNQSDANQRVEDLVTKVKLAHIISFEVQGVLKETA